MLSDLHQLRTSLIHDFHDSWPVHKIALRMFSHVEKGETTGNNRILVPRIPWLPLQVWKAAFVSCQEGILSAGAPQRRCSKPSDLPKSVENGEEVFI